jgi:uncharacterized protein (TIGR03067 family)
MKCPALALTFGLLLPVMVCLAGCGSVPDAASEDDGLLAKTAPAEDGSLRGKWKAVRFERWGGAWDVNDVGQTWEFTSNAVTCPDKAAFAVEGIYRIRPKKIPKEIDIKTVKGKEIPGIYSVEDDTLKLCIDYADSRLRPTAFASVGKSEIWLIVFERMKPVAVAR